MHLMRIVLSSSFCLVFSAQRLTVTSYDMIGRYFMLAVRTRFRATRVLTFAYWVPLP